MQNVSGKKTYLIVGLGRFGTALSLRLAETGAHVIAVDKVRSRVDDLSDRLEYVAQLDATDEAALVKIGAKDADIAVVCLGEKSEAAILVTAILIEMGVPRVVARASDELQAKILAKVGVHGIIAPEAEMGRRTADTLENPWMSNFTELGDANHVTGKIKPSAALVGKSLKDLALPSKYGTIIMIVERKGKNILPSADLIIEKDDRIWLFGEKARMTPLIESIEMEE